MPHPKGSESLQDLVDKIADNVQLTSRLIRRLPQSLASHLLAAPGAATGPAPVVAPPQQGDGAAIDKTTPPVVPEGHYARCVRCSYTWHPRLRYPKTCPRCVAPWWYPARHRWHADKLTTKEWRRGRRSTKKE